MFDKILPAAGHPIHTWAAKVSAAAKTALKNRHLRDVSTLSDAQLKDIGLTRHDVEIATRMPFTHDATAELRRAVWRRSNGQW